VLGLCGGYQMLGREIYDPAGIEGPAGSAAGLGLLDVSTTLGQRKRLAPVSGTTGDGLPFSGYEMHVGETAGPDVARPFLHLSDGRADGAVSADGRVCGTYVHGLFSDDRLRSAWIERLGGSASDLAYEAGVEEALDALARHLERHLDIDGLISHAS
jgi:adenosylcobyric acid synthase